MEALARESEEGGAAVEKCEPEALRALVLKSLTFEEMEVECGSPRRWPLALLVSVGEAEIRPEGAADVEGAAARSCVQANGIVKS